MACYNSELPIGPQGPTGPQGPQGESAALPYKVYTALLIQSGEDAPTVVELENTLGEITFGYENVGIYSISSSSLFTIPKTAVFISPLNDAIAVINLNSSSQYFLETIVIGGSNQNNLLNYTAIEIRVYN
jgi:hypothetical protein